MFIAHVTLPTRSAKQSSEFYRAIFGWPNVSRPTDPNSPNGAWMKVGPAQELHLTELVDYQPPDHEDEFGRHFAIMLSGTQFDAAIAAMQERDAELIAPKRKTVRRRLFLRDPSGHMLELIDVDSDRI